MNPLNFTKKNFLNKPHIIRFFMSIQMIVILVIIGLIAGMLGGLVGVGGGL